MNSKNYFKIVILFFLICIVYGCASDGGEVVKVTKVAENALADLKKADLEKIEEIKKSGGDKGIDKNLTNVIQQTPHFSVGEYVNKYPEAAGQSAKDYKLGGYDVLSVTVYEEKDLSRDALRVSGDGYISYPLIGRLQVNGMSTSEIEKLISSKLALGKYLLDAHVSVMVTEFNSQNYLVLGSVQKPGTYPLKAQDRVLDAISKSEGISGDKASKKAMIIRTLAQEPNKGQKVIINVDLQDILKKGNQFSNIFLVDKDVIYIPTAESFYIIGQVKTPGSYVIPEKEITLVEAISMAGGFTPIAARNKTRIVRVENGVEKIIQVQVDAITEAGKKIHDVIIVPGDIIVVPESFF
ncbi:MAG: polysaccharide biosynthesis/export family protein [Desulfobacterales bacterium]|nr:polysaccharide biosynthesis/export family protein [Desulfobacterales bacterium]